MSTFEVTDQSVVRAALDEALRGRRLLDHPFYRRWEHGLLSPGELAEYAEQYRHVEAALPHVLESVAAGLPPGRARTLLEANLADELGEGGPEEVSHAELFESFAAAVSASASAFPTSATAELVDMEISAASSDPIAAIAMLSAYEVQAAGIASSKGEGLRRHYQLDRAGTEFWDVHAELEGSHARWSIEALSCLGAAPEVVVGAAKAGADAWWSLLDERESRNQDGAIPSSTIGSRRDS